MINFEKFDKLNTKPINWFDWFRVNYEKYELKNWYSYLLLGITAIAYLIVLYLFISNITSNIDTQIFISILGVTIGFLIVPICAIGLDLLITPNYEYINLNESYMVEIDGKKVYMSEWYYRYINTKENNYICTVSRENNRKHWKNRIPENRVLTYKEYKNLKKALNKKEKLESQANEIKEFSEYYGLEVKEIDDIIKDMLNKEIKL